MNLESRVEVLEHELKILKNEIEETLLEIHDQVLVHYYPALRSDDSTAPVELSAPPSKSQTKSSNLPHPLADAVAQPRASKAEHKSADSRLDALQSSDIKSGDIQHRQPMNAPLLPSVQGIPSAPGLSTTALSSLAKWVSNAVERVGKTNALQMIDSCTAEMNCSDAIKSALLQLIDLSVEEFPAQQVDTTALMDLILSLNKVIQQAMRAEVQSTTEASAA